jgi:hypothetical protein
MDVTFDNVTITVQADSPEEAYTALCNALGASSTFIDWQTDTFDTRGADGNFDRCRDTSELFPSTN